MKKIPTLFERVYDNHKVVGITPKVTPGCEFVLEGKGVATVKIDGACCAVIDGKFYKRYDARGKRKIPDGAIPCGDPDPVTGHWPHWVPVREHHTADKWYWAAYANRKYEEGSVSDGTYEAVGVHFQGNPYGAKSDFILRHGKKPAIMERTFEGIREWLETHEEEGLVFWLDGEPRCKIKRTDFGLKWPVRRDKC